MVACTILRPGISVHIKTEETERRVDGGSEEHEATREFAAKGPVLVGDLRVGKNRIQCAEPAWMVL